MTWPAAARLGDGMLDVWDGKLNLRILHWDWYQTFHDPLRLFQLPIFHPVPDALAFSENLYGAAVFGFPLLSAGASPVVNYNVVFLAGVFLSALSAWALARYVTGDPLASAAAGLVYAFLPWRISQISHVQHQWGAFLCLLLLFLLRYLDGARGRDLAAFGALFAWNLLANVHYGIFAGLLVLVVAGVAAAWRPPGRCAAALAAAALATAACAPFLLPYLRVSRTYGVRRGLTEILYYSGRWTDFLSAGDRNRLYGRLLARWDAPEGFFFPGLLAPVLAAAALWRLRAARPGSPAKASPLPAWRGRLARALDAAILLGVALALASWRTPRLRLGPLSAGDPGRVLVVVTALAVVRLAAAFPRRARRASLADWVRRSFADPRAILFAAIVLLGVVVALGAHTPYYRFLFQSFGAVFGAIRAPSRGIVLFDLGLAVLAAWGLSLLTRRLPRRRRLAAAAAAVAVLGVEYRAFPLSVFPVDAAAPAVYRWLATVDTRSGVVEWPLGDDFDYVFRQTAHNRPIVNGYSGFFPPAYMDLYALLRRRPIPDEVWAAMGRMDAGLVVYHVHDTRGFRIVAYADAVDHALATGNLEAVRTFSHDGGLDVLLLPTGSPLRPFALVGSPQSAAEARAAYDAAAAALRRDSVRFAAPFGVIGRPEEGERVEPGFWVHGWALDDSGVAEVRGETEMGPAGVAMLGGPWGGVAQAYPDYPGTERPGWGFAVPDLPPGRHRLRVIIVGRDGGSSVLERDIVVDARSRRAP
jgi:hypothetical protein